MHTEGWFAPETVEEAREQYESVGPAAQTVVREVARAMSFDRDEYADRVSSDVVETARDSLFASLLEVHVGTHEEYASWREAYDGEVIEHGSDSVDNVAWHAGPENVAVAATFQSKPDAAVGTLRRQAFGTIYRELFEQASSEE
ncbi:DUF5809 family protein [Natrialbaceae archaeon A-chndr2]